MKKIKNNVTLLNTISSIIYQVIVIISGFIIPKIILEYFGSEINGMISSINQFLCYINLLEGGVGAVIVAYLYKLLVEKDEKKISSVVKTANGFFKKISLIFVIYSIIIAIVSPFFLDTDQSKLFIFSLVIISSINLFIQYCFSITYRCLLSADKKVYIVTGTQSIILTFNIILAIISVKIYPNVLFFKFMTSIMYICQPIIFNYFVKKFYNLNKEAKIDNNLLKNRWSGLSINIASFIHDSTDTIILTLFTTLETVSIYSVYSLVTIGLKQLIVSISNGIKPVIGHLYYSNNKEELNKKFDMYEFIMFLIVFILLSLAGLLITPFVMLYTKNINDANYYQPLFGYLIVISEIFSLIKYPHLTLAYSANKFKEITIPCFIEAGINIVISLLLVKKFKLIGIVIGTIIAMIYRMIFHVYFTKKELINRPQWLFYKKLLIFSIFTFIGIFICKFFIHKIEYTIISWIIHGLIYSFIMIILYFIMSLIFFKKEFKYLKSYLFK